MCPLTLSWGGGEIYRMTAFHTYSYSWVSAWTMFPPLILFPFKRVFFTKQLFYRVHFFPPAHPPIGFFILEFFTQCTFSPSPWVNFYMWFFTNAFTERIRHAWKCVFFTCELLHGTCCPPGSFLHVYLLQQRFTRGNFPGFFTRTLINESPYRTYYFRRPPIYG